jgi:Uma2 family endonuclease
MEPMDAPSDADVHAEDPVVYPVTDHVGESGLQSLIIRGLLALLDDYFAALGRPVLAGGDQFIYYKQFDNRSVVAPDIYLIDDETLSQGDVKSWKVWERGGKVPTLALEIVSSDYRKDYRPEIVARYQALGVRELVRYDPEPEGDTRRLFSHWLREPSGLLAPRQTLPDRVRSAAYDFWLVRRPDRTLGLATGANGFTAWKTAGERRAEAAERAAHQAERAAAAAEAAARQAAAREAAERAAREAAEARVERLLAELARSRGEG